MDVGGERHQRIAAIEARQHVRQEFGDGAFDDGDRDMAATEAAELLELGASPAIVLLPAAHALDQDLARRGKAEATRQALEERRAELVLELQDLSVDRRWRDVEPVR